MLSDIENGKIKKNASPGQLYNLQSAVNQTTNLYNEYPEVVAEMKTTLNAYHAPKQRNAVDKSRSKKRNRRKELKKPAETET